jgi:hypothetical protein
MTANKLSAAWIIPVCGTAAWQPPMLFCKSISSGRAPPGSGRFSFRLSQKLARTHALGDGRAAISRLFDAQALLDTLSADARRFSDSERL